MQCHPELACPPKAWFQDLLILIGVKDSDPPIGGRNDVNNTFRVGSVILII